MTKLLYEEQQILANSGEQLWLLFDRIDELQSSDPDERRKLIESLFRVQLSFMSRFPNIRLKIFLRTDIWSEINFTNKTHISDKMIFLDWDEERLLRLIDKRIIASDRVRDYVESKLGMDLDPNSIEELSKGKLHEIFYSVFADQVYSGPREADLFDWMVSRITDGLGGIYPRELILFCKIAKEEQLKANDDPDERLIEGKPVRNAYYKVSETRVDTYLSEFPDLQDHIHQFSGKRQAEFERSELESMFEGLSPAGDDAIDRLHDVGVLKPKGGKDHSVASEFEIPRLYREGLGLVIRGRP